jgi:hypothetical protein
MAAHVDRHAVEPDREIGAVIEIEAAQEVLVCLPSPECCVTIRPGAASSISPEMRRSDAASVG